MPEKFRSSEAVRALLRRYDVRFQPALDGPSPDEMAQFLEAASRLPPGRLRQLVAAVREALAEQRALDGD